MHDPEEPQAGREVHPEDAGVPDDPPGPDVPSDTGSALAPDPPADPTTEQPEGTQGVEGADPGEREADGADAGPADEAQDEPD